MSRLYDSKDMLFGKSLLIWGRKFTRNTKQNFIKITGPGGSRIKKIVNDPKEIEAIKKECQGYNMRGNYDDMFDKIMNLIAEPQEDSDCPDYMGTDKHAAKKYSHTPGTEYKVEAIGLCAVCYIDNDRQPRKPSIVEKKFKLESKYSLSNP